MQWTPGGVSGDIEDRRNEGGGGGGFGFGGGGFGGLHIGIGGLLVLLVLSFIFKVNLIGLFTGGAVTTAPQQAVGDADRGESGGREVQFVSFVLDDVQHTWDRIRPNSGTSYRHAKLVLFRDYTQSGCGTAQSATIEAYLRKRLKEHVQVTRSEGQVAKGLIKPSTVHQEFRVLRRMLNVAVRKSCWWQTPASGSTGEAA